MAEDDGRIPRGVVLPRLDPDAVLDVRPRPRASERASEPAPAHAPVPAPAAAPGPPAEPARPEVRVEVPALDLPESPAVPGPGPRGWLRGPLVGAALATLLVVLVLGLMVPGLIGGDKTRTTSLPAPGETTRVAVTGAPTATPSPTSKQKPTKIDKATATVTHTPSRTAKATGNGSGSGAVPVKGGSSTPSTPSATTTTPKQVWGTTVIPLNTALKVGENWHTNRIKLSLTADGDAELTNENGKVTWSAGKTGGTALAFQGDGNLVLYKNNTVLWASETAGHEGAQLVLQDDGNVTISAGDEFLWGAL